MNSKPLSPEALRSLLHGETIEEVPTFEQLIEQLQEGMSEEEIAAIDEKVGAFMAEEVSLEDLLGIEDPLA